MRLPYRLQAGSWQPARLMRADHVLIMGWLVITAYVRGYDYLVGNDTWGAKDFMLAAAPEWVWGWGFLIGAAILAGGILRRRHLLVWLGHGWLCIAYGINALAQAFASGGGLYVLAFLAGMGAIALAALRRSGWTAVGVALVFIPVWLGLAVVSGETLNGIRGTGSLGLVAIIHGVYHLRTGISPLRPVDMEPVETIGGEA